MWNVIRKYAALTVVSLDATTAVLAKDRPLVLEEVLVTAEKSAKSLEDTPMTVNVITGNEVEKMASFNFSDLNQQTSGLVIGGVGSDADIGTRGLGTELRAAVTPRVTIYLDGAFVTSKRGLFSGLFDLQQLELLRGPQGTLYGQASPAGALTIKSRDPDLQQIEGFLQQSFTERSTMNTQFGISLPIVEDQLSVRLSGFYDKQEYSDVRNETLNKDQEFETNAFRATVMWQPNDKFNTRLSYHDIRDEYDVDPVVKGNGVSPFDRIALSNVESTGGNDTSITVIELNYSINDDLTTTFIASYQDNVDDRLIDLDGSAVSGSEQRIKSDTRGSKNFEWRLARQGDPVWNWTVGAFLDDSEGQTDVNVRKRIATNAGPFGIFTTTADVTGPVFNKTENYGIFTHNVFHLSQSATLTAGLRYLADKRESQQTQVISVATTPFPSPNDGTFTNQGVLPQDQKIDENAVTGTVKFQYSFTDDLMAYISYDKGWRVGSSNISGGPQPPEFGKIDNEDSQNFEIGYKWSLWEGRALWNMALYYQVYDDFQYQAENVTFRQPATLGGGTGRESPVVNVEEAISYGLDTDIALLLTPNWRLNASLSWNKSELSDAKNVPCTNGQPIGSADWSYNSCDLTDERAGSYPELSANISTEYFRPFSEASEWYLRALINAESKYYSAAENDDLDGYTTLDLHLGWRTTDKVWDARLWVKNVSDEEAELKTSALDPAPDYQNGGTLPAYTRVERQLDPRLIGVTINYNF